MNIKVSFVDAKQNNLQMEGGLFRCRITYDIYKQFDHGPVMWLQQYKPGTGSSSNLAGISITNNSYRVVCKYVHTTHALSSKG
jgi:hypothetical protein